MEEFIGLEEGCEGEGVEEVDEVDELERGSMLSYVGFNKWCRWFGNRLWNNLWFY